MQIIFFILAVGILVVLYMMTRQKKTYTYTRVTVISYQSDGTEYITTSDKTGSIDLTNATVKIDNKIYKHKTLDSRKAEAVLHYANGRLRSVSILLPIGEKSYFIPDDRVG
jgi:hypothetical protein